MGMKYKSIMLSFLGVFLFSCDEIIMEEDLSDSQLVILAPADNAGFNSTSVTFTWQPLDGATSYVLQIAKPDFENATEIVLNTDVITSYSIHYTKLYENLTLLIYTSSPYLLHSI